MNPSRLLLLLIALAVVGAGFYAAYRATEPPGRGLAPGEVQATHARERDLRDAGISRTAEKERRLRESLKPGDFDGAVQLAHTRRLMLMLKADRDGTDRASISEDPQLRHILCLCRRWARNDGERGLVDSLARPMENLPAVR